MLQRRSFLASIGAAVCGLFAGWRPKPACSLISNWKVSSEPALGLEFDTTKNGRTIIVYYPPGSDCYALPANVPIDNRAIAQQILDYAARCENANCPSTAHGTICVLNQAREGRGLDPDWRIEVLPIAPPSVVDATPRHDHLTFNSPTDYLLWLHNA